ncbi:MAG: DUF4224 domain-containing protein [Candidatus Binataceae bacterium]
MESNSANKSAKQAKALKIMAIALKIGLNGTIKVSRSFARYETFIVPAPFMSTVLVKLRLKMSVLRLLQ